MTCGDCQRAAEESDGNLNQWANLSILIGIIFGAAQVKAAIESLRHAVDRLDQPCGCLTRAQASSSMLPD